MGRRSNLRLAYLSAVVNSSPRVTVSASRPSSIGRSSASTRSVSPIRSTQPGLAVQVSAPSSSPVGVTVTPSTAAANPTLTTAAQAQAAAATPAAIIAQFCPSGITKQPCGCSVDSASMQTLFTNSVQSRYLMWPPPDSSFANCSGVTGETGVQKAGTIVSGAGALTAGAAVAAGAAAGSVVPVIGTAVGAIAGLIAGIIGGSHAKAVAAQNSALCNAVPAVNAALQQIDSELATGQITPAQASGYYSQIQSQFTAALKAGTSYKQCDALYAYNLALQMVLAARNQDLQTSTGAVATGVDTLATSLGVSPLVLVGGAALVAWLLFS